MSAGSMDEFVPQKGLRSASVSADDRLPAAFDIVNTRPWPQPLSAHRRRGRPFRVHAQDPCSNVLPFVTRSIDGRLVCTRTIHRVYPVPISRLNEQSTWLVFENTRCLRVITRLQQQQTVMIVVHAVLSMIVGSHRRVTLYIYTAHSRAINSFAVAITERLLLRLESISPSARNDSA